MRLLVFLTAIAIAAIWVVVEHPPQTALAESSRTSRAGEIQSIAFDGRGLPTAALRAVLTSHSGEQLDPVKLARDRKALEETLVASGYYIASVGEPQLVRDASGGVFVTFAIVQGPQFRVRSVAVTGVTAKAAGVVTLSPGEVVLADRIAHARAALADRLASDVVVRLHPDVESAVVDVELNAR